MTSFEDRVMLEAYMKRAWRNLERSGNTIIGGEPVNHFAEMIPDLKRALELAEKLGKEE